MPVSINAMAARRAVVLHDSPGQGEAGEEAAAYLGRVTYPQGHFELASGMNTSRTLASMKWLTLIALALLTVAVLAIQLIEKKD